MKASDTYADLYIRRVGFDDMVVTATRDDPAANIIATVECHGDKPCGPTHIPSVLGTPSPDEGVKSGNVLLLILLPFIIAIGVALLPVWIIVWIVDHVTGSNEEKNVKKVREELKKLLPTWFR